MAVLSMSLSVWMNSWFIYVFITTFRLKHYMHTLGLVSQTLSGDVLSKN